MNHSSGCSHPRDFDRSRTVRDQLSDPNGTRLDRLFEWSAKPVSFVQCISLFTAYRCPHLDHKLWLHGRLIILPTSQNHGYVDLCMTYIMIAHTR
jgi:hypothetical protein